MPLKRYRSKPTTIMAVRFLELADVEDLPGVVVQSVEPPVVRFLTIQGEETTAKPGEWLAQERGTKDRWYPIEHENFLARWARAV